MEPMTFKNHTLRNRNRNRSGVVGSRNVDTLHPIRTML